MQSKQCFCPKICPRSRGKWPEGSKGGCPPLSILTVARNTLIAFVPYPINHCVHFIEQAFGSDPDDFEPMVGKELISYLIPYSVMQVSINLDC